MTSNTYISNGTTFSKYKPYIHNGTTWIPYNPQNFEHNYNLETLTGNLIHFTNGELNSSIEELKIDIPYTEAGLTSILLTHCGKNIFNDLAILKPNNNYSQLGEHEFSGSASGYYAQYKSAAGGLFRATVGSKTNWPYQITFSFDVKNPESYTGSGGYQIICIYTDSTSADIISKQNNSVYTHRTGHTTASKNIKKIYYTYGKDTTMTFKNWQVEIGNEETEFEPYNGQTYTIKFNKTIYGGTVDILNGILTSTLASDGTELNTPEVSSITPIRIKQKSGINNFMVNALGNIILKYYSNTSTITNNTLTGRYITFNDGVKNGQITNCKVTFPALDGVTYNGIKFYHQGENLFPSEFPSNTIHASLGNSGVTSATNGRTFTIPCVPNTIYHFSQSPRADWSVGYTNQEQPIIKNTELTYKGSMANRNNVDWSSEDYNFIIINIVNEARFHESKEYKIQIEKNGSYSPKYKDMYFKEYIYNFDTPITSGELNLLTGKLVDQDGNEYWLNGLPSLVTLKGVNNFSVGNINTSLSLTYQTY